LRLQDKLKSGYAGLPDDKVNQKLAAIPYSEDSIAAMDSFNDLCASQARTPSLEEVESLVLENGAYCDSCTVFCSHCMHAMLLHSLCDLSVVASASRRSGH
jgi:hypothetical protein